MSFIKRVSDCNMIPRGYGVAWYDDYGRYQIAMPLGINYLAGLLRHLIYKIGCGYRARGEHEVLDASHYKFLEKQFMELRHKNEMLEREVETLRYLKRGLEEIANEK